MYETRTSSDLDTRGRIALQMDTTRLISSITASGMSSKSILRRITMVSRCAFRNSRTYFGNLANVIRGSSDTVVCTYLRGGGVVRAAQRHQHSVDKLKSRHEQLMVSLDSGREETTLICAEHSVEWHNIRDTDSTYQRTSDLLLAGHRDSRSG